MDDHYLGMDVSFHGSDEGDLREVEICDDEEEERACHEDIVVVLVNIGEGAGAGFRDCVTSVSIFAFSTHAIASLSGCDFETEKASDDLLPTLTTKCEAAARPMTFERSAIGRTSAP